MIVLGNKFVHFDPRFPDDNEHCCVATADISGTARTACRSSAQAPQRKKRQRSSSVEVPNVATSSAVAISAERVDVAGPSAVPCGSSVLVNVALDAASGSDVRHAEPLDEKVLDHILDGISDEFIDTLLSYCDEQKDVPSSSQSPAASAELLPLASPAERVDVAGPSKVVSAQVMDTVKDEDDDEIQVIEVKREPLEVKSRVTAH